MNRSGMGYAKIGREQKERQERHKADRGKKTKGTKSGHSGSAYPQRSHTIDTMYPHKKTARLKAKAASVKKEAVEYTGPKKGELKGYGSKAFKEYEKNMDPKKRQALKDKATKGMKFTHEGTSYGLYKGSGKPGGAMRKYLDNDKENAASR